MVAAFIKQSLRNECAVDQDVTVLNNMTATLFNDEKAAEKGLWERLSAEVLSGESPTVKRYLDIKRQREYERKMAALQRNKSH